MIKKTIVLFFLVVNTYGFNSNTIIDATEINTYFEDMKTQIEAKDLKISFDVFTNGEIISSKLIDNIKKIDSKFIGLGVTNIPGSGDFITADYLNQLKLNFDAYISTLSFKSCKEILDNGSSHGTDIYTIDPDGSGSANPFQVYCNMDIDGGGWTLVMKTARDEESCTSTIGRAQSRNIANLTNPIFAVLGIHSSAKLQDSAIRNIANAGNQEFTYLQDGETEGSFILRKDNWNNYSSNSRTTWDSVKLQNGNYQVLTNKDSGGYCQPHFSYYGFSTWQMGSCPSYRTGGNSNYLTACNTGGRTYFSNLIYVR